MLLELESVIDELVTVRDFLRWSVSRFNEANIFLGQGTDNPWDEALALVLYALHLPIDVDERILDSRLTLDEREQIAYLIKQRIEKRTPTAYLTQTAYLNGVPFFVDERVIIPRSPIAELISQAFQPWAKFSGQARLLDMCTGSGCLALLAALEIDDLEVDAVDLSDEALEVAAINRRRFGLESEVALIKSDLFNELDAMRKYDVIISNPPYVGADELESAPLEIQHEPKLALISEENGVAIASSIITNAGTYLKPDGILILEVGNSQGLLEEAFPELEFLWVDFERGGTGVCLLKAEQLVNLI